VQRKQCGVQSFGKKPYPTGSADALFLRWRETIEKAISDKFDAVGSPDDTSVHLFLKDLKRLPADR
jgi:hypothetical protein